MFGRRKYEDDYEEADDNAIGGSTVPPQKLTLIDYIIALLIGIVAMMLCIGLGYHGQSVHPSIWKDCAEAFGLRPAESIVPGFWRLIARGLYNGLGAQGAISTLGVLGKVVLGLIIALTYLTFKEILAILVRMIDTDNVWCRVLSRGACVVAALMFLCADPVWSLGSCLSPALLKAFLFSLTVFLLARFLAAGSILPAYFAMFCLGLLGAETPLGLIALVGFWLIFYMLLTKGGLFHVQLLQPLLQQSSKWYLTFYWALGLILGLTLNIWGFKMCEGLIANGMSASDVPLRYASTLWHDLSGAARPGAWILGIGSSTLLFVLGVSMLRRATDLEYFLPYRTGIVFFVIGALSYTQLSSVYPLWFWCREAITVNSKVLLFLCMQMLSVGVLTALSVALVDTFCRDHRRLAAQLDPDLEESLPRETSSRGYWVKGPVFILVVGALFAGTFIDHVYLQKTRKVLALINDYVGEVVTEAGDAKFLFTDGFYDCGYEVEALRRGKKLVCFAVQPNNCARKGYALTQYMDNAEDRLSAEAGGANILRNWQKSKYRRFEECGFQLGLEQWVEHTGQPAPMIGGVMAKTTWGPSDEAFVQGTDRGRALMERVLELYADKKGILPSYLGRDLRDLCLFLQWRLARLAHQRGDRCDLMRDYVQAEQNRSFAEKLDDNNEAIEVLQKALMHARQHLMGQVTPRKALRMALECHNYPLAHRYAETILDADDSFFEANHAIGVDYLLQEQYSRAEIYLVKCVEICQAERARIAADLAREDLDMDTRDELEQEARNERMNEAASRNNLAELYKCQKQYEKALRFATEAHDLEPRNKTFRRTLQQIKDKLEAETKGNPTDK